MTSKADDQRPKSQNVLTWEEVECKLEVVEEEEKKEIKPSFKDVMRRFIDSWLEYPDVALGPYATTMFRHFMFGLVPTVADICTDMALVHIYLNENYYSVTKQNNGN